MCGVRFRVAACKREEYGAFFGALVRSILASKVGVDRRRMGKAFYFSFSQVFSTSWKGVAEARNGT